MKFPVILFGLGNIILFLVSCQADLLPLQSNQFVCSPDKKCVASWKDDGKKPSLSSLKPLTVELMTGTDINQLSLLKNGPINPNSKSTSFKIPKDLGPSGNYYFFKFTSGTNEHWSARFSVVNINGTIPDNPAITTNSSSSLPYETESPYTSPSTKTTTSPAVTGSSPATTGATKTNFGTNEAETPGSSSTASSITFDTIKTMACVMIGMYIFGNIL